MTTANHALRKAAILVSSLDSDTADRLLDQMSPAQADAVRRVAAEMRDIDPAEQDRVVSEFFAGTKSARTPDPGVELDPSLLRALEREEAEAEAHDASDEMRYLVQAPFDELSQALAEERPQTIAVVLSQLPHDRAARLLATFNTELRAEVVDRLLNLEEAHPDAVREVEQGVRAWIERQAESQRRKVTGVATLRAILEAAEDAERDSLLHSMAAAAPILADDFIPMPEPAMEMWTFADVEALDDAEIAEVLAAADDETRRLALAGASPEFFTRVLALLPKAEADRMRRAVLQLGPINLTDIEQAQNDLAQLAEGLVMSGWPSVADQNLRAA